MKNYVRIWTGLIISIVIIILKYTFEDDTELFKGGAFFLDVFLFNISLAFIASSIFYYIVIYLPRRRDQKNIHESVRLNLTDIIVGTKIVFNTLFRHVGINKDFYEITSGDIKELCPKIKLKGKTRLLKGFVLYTDVDFAQFLMFYKDRQYVQIEKLFAYAPFLESDLVKYLSNIINSPYYIMCDEAIKDYKSYEDPDLTSFSNELFEYYKNIRQLEDYCKKTEIIGKSI